MSLTIEQLELLNKDFNEYIIKSIKDFIKDDDENSLIYLMIECDAIGFDNSFK